MTLALLTLAAALVLVHPATGAMVCCCVMLACACEPPTPPPPALPWEPWG